MKIAPSMLACSFDKMGYETERISNSGADLIHLDVMDGNFVPNISFGADIIKSIRKYTSLPFDVHLMIDNPSRYIKNFADAGADIITFHIEAENDIIGTIDKIKKFGVKPGISIKPNTPAREVFDYLDKVYMILVMTVEPGFGGQSFMADMLDKVIEIKQEAKKRNIDILVEVDGGINKDTVAVASNSGVDICVAGTSVFKSDNPCNAISELKNLSQ